MTTTYDLGMSSATGNGFAMRRIVVEADDIKAATLLAQEAEPGFLVHCGWAIEGDDYPRTNPQDLEWWMATHVKGALRTQNPGSDSEEGS